MNKQGFVFMESVIVLVVVALSLTMLISSYSLITRKTQEKEYYDRASDKYLLYSITNIGISDSCNYTLSGSCGYEGINLQANAKNCNNTRVGKLLYNCNKTFQDMNIRYIYVVDDIQKELTKDDAVSRYDNGVIEYMKTLKKCNDVNYDSSKTCEDPISYMIGVFYRSGNYYYASIEIDAITEECEEGYYLSSITKKCEKNEYTITFDKQDGKDGSNIIKASNGIKPENISIPTKEDYVFEGYYTQENGNGIKYYDKLGTSLLAFNGIDNMTLYANWVPSTYNYEYKGSEYEFIVPMDGTYKIELWGASGGDFKTPYDGIFPDSYGRGAYTKGEIKLNKGEKLYVYVGENYNDYGGAKLIYNGGGPGESAGGGATDVRLTKGVWDNFDSLKSRIMVAAAGGGGAANSGRITANEENQRGDGGGLNGPTPSYTYTSSGGGGGYYGGGHGNHPGNSWTGGGGGSSFISGYPGCNAISKDSTQDKIIHTNQENHYSGKVFTETQMIAGNAEMPNPTGGTETGHTGNGYARITIVN